MKGECTLKQAPKTAHAFLSLLAILIAFGVATNAFAQFPRKTDEHVKQQILDTMTKYPAFTVIGKKIAEKYEAFKVMSPPHPLGCPKMVPTQLSEEIWKFDSEMLILSKMSVHFLSCFESTAMPDVGGGAVCIPVYGVPGLEYCEDPPGAVVLGFIGAVLPEELEKCCPTDSELLAMPDCSIPINKPNAGFKLTYWWPENEVEINNYETTAFDPAWECGNNTEYFHKPLTDFLRQAQAHLNMINKATVYKTTKEAGIPDALREDPFIGNSHWAGLLPGDQILAGEAHVWRTYLASLASLNNREGGGWLGYKRNCDCFYAAGQKQEDDYGVRRKVVNGWTEEKKYFHYWRDYRLSRYLGPAKYEAIEQFQDPRTDMCASYRAYHEQWGKAIAAGGMGYGDLISAVNIKPPRIPNALERICYKGGGDLFPIVGQLIGHFSPLPANAYMARRALYLFGKDNIATGSFVPPGRVINKFSERYDKMQRIWPLYVDSLNPLAAAAAPLASSCFRGNEIPNYVQEAQPDRPEDWPKGLVRDVLDDTQPVRGGPKDSVRHAYWNRRKNCMCPYIGPVAGLKWFGKYTSCFQTKSACRKRDEGNFEDPDESKLDPPDAEKGVSLEHLIDVPFPGAADGIPYPFLPEFGKAIYTLDPIKGDDPAFRQGASGVGQGDVCDLKKGPFKMHRVYPEDLESSRPYRGLKCPFQDDRCKTQ